MSDTGLTLEFMSWLMETRLVCASAASKGAGLRHIAALRRLGHDVGEFCRYCGEAIEWDARARLWSRFTIFEEPW